MTKKEKERQEQDKILRLQKKALAEKQKRERKLEDAPLIQGVQVNERRLDNNEYEFVAGTKDIGDIGLKDDLFRGGSDESSEGEDFA